MINQVSDFCGENGLTINYKKTKCMIFNKSGHLLRDIFDLNGNVLENVREYKYLGFLITPSGAISTGLKDLRDRAFKAFKTLKYKMGEFFRRDVKTALGLYDSMIKPILTYSSDFWGCLQLPKTNNPIETLTVKIYKEILGVKKQTVNMGVLLEIGRTTLDYDCIKLGVKNWERIRKKNANKILMESYTEAVEEQLPWIMGIKGHLERNGLLSLFIKDFPNEPNFVHKKLHSSLVDQFFQNTFAAIGDQGSKLRTYALFKKERGLEDYLFKIQNIDVRTKIAKFRISDHTLRIETGRKEHIPRERRFCNFFHQKPETEIHFLMECPVYQHLCQSTFCHIKKRKTGF